MTTTLLRLTLVAGLALLAGAGIGCGAHVGGGGVEPGGAGAGTPGAERSGLAPAQAVWWASLRSLCGKAYSGELVQGDPADDAFAGQPMTMHVRRCGEDRIEIPFVVGGDRSRTWVVTRTGAGLALHHDHRHEDGTQDDVTWYGGHTQWPGTELVQVFPADERSKELFAEHGLAQSVANVWSLALVPGERFSYALRRPGRHFRVDFDLTEPVEPPPAPWGHEPE